MNAAELARSAAELIAEKGHVKHKLHDPETGAYCAVGAVVEIGGTVVQRGLIYEVAEELIGAPGDYRGMDLSLVEYNNAPGTSAEDVILLLKRTAEYLEANPERV